MVLKCRACLSIMDEMINIFEPSFEGLTLAEMLEFNTVFQVKEHDGLPKYVCTNCAIFITKSYGFVKVFQESEKYLQALVSSELDLTSKPLLSDDALSNIVKDEEDETTEFETIYINSDIEAVSPSQSFVKEMRVSEQDICDELVQSVLNSKDECGACVSNMKYKKYRNIRHNCHKKYMCEHCGMAFSKKSYLTDHAVVHSTERRLSCNICNKSYRHRNALRQHKKSHLNVRNLVCEKCGQSFNNSGTLKTHIKLKHTQEKNYPCTVCGICFAMRSWLNKHTLRRHNGERERNYVCSICGIAYFEKTTLNRHVSVKHSENGKKHSCSTCSKQYTTKTNLVKHFKSVHGLGAITEDDNSILNIKNIRTDIISIN